MVVLCSIAVLPAASCTSEPKSCETTRTCPPKVTDDGGAGAGAEGGEHGGSADAGAGSPGSGGTSSGGTGGTREPPSDAGTGGADDGSGGEAGVPGDSCASMPCEEGECVRLGSDFRCDCYRGFTGDLCDLSRFELLGRLPGFDGSIGMVLSDDGNVVYGYDHDVESASTVPFRWTHESGKQLFAPTGFEVLSTSSDGAVAVGYGPNSDGIETAFRWSDASGFIDLGAIPGGDAMSSSGATATNADGSVIVGTCQVSSGAFGYRWTAATGIVRLPLPSGVSASATLTPSSMSSDGETIVGTMRDGGVTEAFRWTSTNGTQRIGLADASIPPMTTGDGSVFVGLSDFGGSARPFRWTSSTGMVPIEPSPPCDFGFPFDVTDDASTVAMTCQTGSDFSAGLWDETNGYRPMVEVLRELGIAVPSDWTLVYSIRVSGDGRAVLGIAANTGGAYEPWIARL